MKQLSLKAESEKQSEVNNEEIKIDSECYELLHNPHKYAWLAKQWLNKNPLFLDTETTGLDHYAEIVEISIIDSTGQPLLDTLIKPAHPIPQDAINIHGITNEMVKNAPTWGDINNRVCQILENRNVVIYNANYDLRIIKQTCCINGKEPVIDKMFRENMNLTTYCAMKLFADFYGEWDDYREDWKWQKLTKAADYMNVKIKGEAHRALSDCRMTLGVLKAMADTLPEKAKTVRKK